jgi:hypothetical protein
MSLINRTRKPKTFTISSICLLALFLALLAVPARAQQVVNMTDVKSWRIWEGQFKTAQAYVNPSYDVKLQVTFTPPAGSGLAPIVSYGFWDGVEGGLNVFKVRTAFPTAPGLSPWVWTWRSTCTGVNVTPSTGAHLLFSHGFLKVKSGGTDAGRYLVHDDGASFFWLGDTAWNASIRAVSAPSGGTAEWEQYLADRRAKGFTVIQMALPVDYMEPPSGDQPHDAQTGHPTPFTQLSLAGRNCTTALPNPCSQWNPDYWKNFEQKVRAANSQGLVVLIVGLAERIIEGPGNPLYPTNTDLQVNARNVVARLGGEFVIFSPGFDRAPSGAGCTTSVNDMTCRIKVVGQEAKNTSSRHLVGNHFAGSMNVTLEDPFINETWLDLQIVQSGSGCNENSEAQQTISLTNRARTMPLHLWNLTTSPGGAHKPVVNVETIYDGASCGPNSQVQTVGNFTPYRARQTAYLSMMSGSFGYGFGVIGAFDWGLGGTTWPTGVARPSSGQMQTLCRAFRSLPAWQQLVPDQSLIANPNDPATGLPWTDPLAMVVARDVNNQFAVAYLPNNAAIKIETAGFTNFAGWTKEWIDPRSGAISAATCLKQGVSTVYRCDRPATPPPAGETADWVLRLGASPFTATTLCG